MQYGSSFYLASSSSMLLKRRQEELYFPKVKKDIILPLTTPSASSHLDVRFLSAAFCPFHHYKNHWQNEVAVSNECYRHLVLTEIT